MSASRSTPAFASSQIDPGSLLRSFAREGDRGGALRAQLADQFPTRSADQIEDAVQQACQAFLEEGEGISTPDRAYLWLRTAAYRHLIHEVRRENRMVPVNPTEGPIEHAASEDPGPAAELVAIEDDRDLAILVEQVAGSLSERRRRILALWAIGLKRPEIATRLGVSERSVKRDLIAIMDEARSVLSREVGGGCLQGEPLIARLIYGLASAPEAEQAHRHLQRCGRCTAFAERLEAWQSKAGALLPVPAVEAASPGVIERIAGRAGHAIGSARRQILGGGAQVRQQAAATYTRTVDPTPLAGVRPGAIAAVVAGCLAVGGGATYCAQNGAGPLGPIADLLGGQESTQQEAPKPPESEEPAAEVMPPAPVEYQPAPETIDEPAPHQESAPEQKSEPEPVVEAESEPEPVAEEETPVESSFEPTTPDYPTEAEPEAASAPTVSAEPKVVPAHEAPQFGGP
ncbi:MAG: hypothetical protein JSU06_10220 [Actinobacteria bacterium]|nr:hypothetical protein [Actinomycetota bacterium]